MQHHAVLSCPNSAREYLNSAPGNTRAAASRIAPAKSFGGMRVRPRRTLSTCAFRSRIRIRVGDVSFKGLKSPKTVIVTAIFQHVHHDIIDVVHGLPGLFL